MKWFTLFFDHADVLWCTSVTLTGRWQNWSVAGNIGFWLLNNTP
jgi:hypothetical protein